MPLHVRSHGADLSYDLEHFAGLYQERQFTSTQPRRYTLMFDEQENTPGFMTCGKDADPPLHPEPYVQECRAGAQIEFTNEGDLSDADYSIPAASITVGERALLFPTPAYAQVRVRMLVATIGAPGLCLPASQPGCDLPADATLEFDVTTACGATFPWGVDHGNDIYTDKERSLPGGFTGADGGILAGTLIRDPDELTYAGDPANDAVETLVPWSVFLAAPGVSLMTGTVPPSGVWRFQWEEVEATVRLWYESTPPVADGLICFMGSA